MRFFLPAWIFFFAWAFSASAEQYAFEQSEATVTYPLAANNFSLKVRHPFRVVRLAGKMMKGSLSFTPDAPEKGISYALEIEVKDLDEPDPGSALMSAVEAQLGAPVIKISGSSLTILRPGAMVAAPGLGVIRPRIEIGPRVSYPEVRIEAGLDGKIIRWNVNSTFTLSDFAIPVPVKWGIPAEDKVTLEGELNFTPKE
jgi:hypothetical protein